MKKVIVPLLLSLVVLVAFLIGSMQVIAENASGNEESSEAVETIPADTLITYGYLEKFREELKQELIEELTAEGGITIATTYNDISATEGQIIILSADSELIYRGGGAVAITSSNKKGEGVSDMSTGKEIFSGESLEYGHIYFASESESKKAILVTGGTAYFTIRGNYEIG